MEMENFQKKRYWRVTINLENTWMKQMLSKCLTQLILTRVGLLITQSLWLLQSTRSNCWQMRNCSQHSRCLIRTIVGQYLQRRLKWYWDRERI
jgi:hypothetical protein